MPLPYFLTHRLLFSSFSAEEAAAAKRRLTEHAIPCLVKTHQSTRDCNAFGQIASCQIAYDVYVPNARFDEAGRVCGR